MKKKQLTVVMPEVYKLAVLILTIPSTTASVERSFSALKRIKSYCRSTQSQERLSGLALISIEKQLLHQLRHNLIFKFQEAVLEKFNSQARRMEFTYK
jgi:hypothetical protein